jgi:hypothetical protein
MERVTSSHCTNLRHKGMYVMSVPDPDESKFYDSYDATAYWCTCTQKGIGPDGQPVHADRCRPGRECCEH